MNRYSDNPMTPNMRAGLRFLANVPTAEPVDVTCVGRPTRQRLAKFGYAVFVPPSDPVDALLVHKGDWPMRITDAGRKAAAS